MEFEEAVLKKAEEIEPLAAHGEVGNGRGRDSNGNSTQVKGGNNLEYTKRRLKRDRPDLLDKVLTGEISTHQAANLSR